MVRIKETQLKSIKKDSLFADTYFVSKYGFSPYRGCQHGCAYCDGRSERYYVEGVFDEDIEVRLNAADTLDQALTKSRELGIVGVSSGVSDAYQPVEGRYALMPRVIDVLIKHAMPAYVMTKSALALRDLEKWKKLNNIAGVTLFVSLTTLDNQIGKHFEPYAALPLKRLEMIQKFKAAGISVVVLAMPLMPKITDEPDRVSQLFQALSEAGVDAVLTGGMTLRPGCQKTHFFTRLAEYDESLCPLYESLYRENRASGVPRKDYMLEQAIKVSRLQKEYGLLNLVPHSLYQNRLQIYDEIWVLLTHMLKLYSQRQVDTARLKASRSRYGKWLEEHKKAFNRNRSMSGNDLDSQFLFMIQTGAFQDLIDNDKLSEFLKSVILERRTLNYRTLKLE